MLPKRNRLTTKEWDFVFKNGRRFQSPCFSFHYLKKGDENNNKIGVSVPKKLAKSAYLRNSIKRDILGALDEVGRQKEGLSLGIVVKSFKNKDESLKELLFSVQKLT